MKRDHGGPRHLYQRIFHSTRVGRLALMALLVTGCATPQPGVIPAPMKMPESVKSSVIAPTGGSTKADELSVKPLPSPPVRAATGTQAPAPVPSTAADSSVAVLNLEQVPLGSFAQLVFAEVLKKNVSVDARVQARRDMVTFRTAQSQTAAQVEQAVRVLLKTYGVSAIEAGGLVRVVPDEASGASFPEIFRGGTTPDTPAPLRPVFHLIELQAVRQTEVTGWLRLLFGDRIKTQEDIGRNALLISGNPDNMSAALEAIRVLDQPVMAGRSSSVALTPAYWSADDLARRLSEVLSAEGYAVQPLGGAGGGVRFPIVLLPVSSVNSVYAFANSEAIIKHISEWARTLDRPSERGIGKNFFTYAVKHKDAAVLAQTLEQLLGGVRVTASATPAGAATQGAGSAARTTSVVVDKAENMLIFQASADEYSQIISLLQKLDRPAKSALIEVTVAELAVDDNAQLGVEWLFNQSLSGGATASGGTLGGLSIGTAGFNYRVLGSAGGVKLLLNALASQNKATILSSPRVTARNGETATIQVGQEVPIVTTQQSTNTANAVGTTGILQSIQYRSTGVILKVKPVIHSGDQVDLDISQEVSAAQSTSTGVNNSPTFSTRKLDTKLTLTNGATVLLGGLISDESNDGNAGIPFLKDLPMVGNAFKTQTKTGRRRELIVLITPYVINDQQDARTITEAFRTMLGPWAGTAPPVPPVQAPSVVPGPARAPAVDATRK